MRSSCCAHRVLNVSVGASLRALAAARGARGFASRLAVHFASLQVRCSQLFGTQRSSNRSCGRGTTSLCSVRCAISAELRPCTLLLLPSARSNDVVRVPSLSRHPSHPCFLRPLPPPYVPSSYLLVAAPDTDLSQAAGPRAAAELVPMATGTARAFRLRARVWERLLGSDAPSSTLRGARPTPSVTVASMSEALRRGRRGADYGEQHDREQHGGEQHGCGC